MVLRFFCFPFSDLHLRESLEGNEAKTVEFLVLSPRFNKYSFFTQIEACDKVQIKTGFMVYLSHDRFDLVDVLRVGLERFVDENWNVHRVPAQCERRLELPAPVGVVEELENN